MERRPESEGCVLSLTIPHILGGNLSESQRKGEKVRTNSELRGVWFGNNYFVTNIIILIFRFNNIKNN